LGLAAVRPERRPRDDVHLPVILAVPTREAHARPLRGGIGDTRGQGGQAASDDAGSSLGAGLTGRGWLEQACVQAQAGDEGGDLSRGGEQVDHRIVLVAPHDEGTLGRPAVQQEDHLPGPARDRFVLPVVLPIVPLGGGKHGERQVHLDAQGNAVLQSGGVRQRQAGPIIY